MSNTGALVAQLRYLPFGGTRWESGSTPTDFQFTGQRHESGFGSANHVVITTRAIMTRQLGGS
jgi:hypothetical protein